MTITGQAEVFNQEERRVVQELWDRYSGDASQMDYFFLVYELHGEIMGFACYGPHALTAGAYDLYWIAVHPRYRNRGVGQALLSAVELQIEALHGRLILIETSSSPPYEAARSFYLARKYTLEATVHDFYAPDDHLLIYTKILPALT